MRFEETEPRTPLADYEKDREAWNLPLPREIVEPAWRHEHLDERTEDLAGNETDLEPAV